ncbi:MAG: arsenate reductase (glutaredoxin) [Rhizobiales bacterium]|nr:arsenate reductase (glutaredoxin) [Hyphomicrobiales bacterium]
MSITIWHNPRCSKSRQTLELLTIQGIKPQIVEYLKQAPSLEDIKSVLDKLGLEPRAIMRKGEAVYKELNLKEVTDDKALIQAMFEHPILIERPIVITDTHAAIGRPPESVLDIL